MNIIFMKFRYKEDIMTGIINIDFPDLKNISENLIISLGGRINPHLPILEYEGIRSSEEILYRVTIMAGMVYIAYKAPTKVIKEWIEQQDIYDYVSDWEKSILNKGEAKVTEDEKLQLRWYVESLWTLVWILGINNNFNLNESVGDNLIEMVPDIKKEEDISVLLKKIVLKTEEEIYEMSDLYYRMHWCLVDARLKGEKFKSFNEGIIMERRKALEWVISPTVDWDDVDLST
jgi:hypothetical protein